MSQKTVTGATLPITGPSGSIWYVPSASVGVAAFSSLQLGEQVVISNVKERDAPEPARATFTVARAGPPQGVTWTVSVLRVPCDCTPSTTAPTVSQSNVSAPFRFSGSWACRVSSTGRPVKPWVPPFDAESTIGRAAVPGGPALSTIRA